MAAACARLVSCAARAGRTLSNNRHSGIGRRSRPGIHEHKPLEYGFRARRCAAPRNDKLELSMSYAVKEIFYTLQGEGALTGRPAVFCRFAGCNLWSGHEEDRAEAICQFCDTDFVGTNGMGGGRFSSAAEVAKAVASRWPADRTGRVRPLVVCTGGEPLLQLDEALVAAFHLEGFEVAIETNGTRLPPHGVDWTCVSPK